MMSECVGTFEGNTGTVVRAGMLSADLRLGLERPHTQALASFYLWRDITLDRWLQSYLSLT